MKSSEVTNVWLDCDPGHDDAFAILLCAFSNKINLLGISTVSGNQLIGHMTSNTLKILNSIGFISESKTGIKTDKTLEFSECKNIGGIRCPVIEGCGTPFFGKPVTASSIHGNTGMEGDWPLPSKEAYDYVRNLSSQNHFTTQIYRHFKDLGKPITILATGPLTNVALLLFNHPDIKVHIEKIVFMGGSMGFGNTGALSEFNIHADPFAASMVCESSLPIYMIPLEGTDSAKFSEKTVDEIMNLNTKCASLFANLISHLIITCDDLVLHDPVAAFFLIDPSSFHYKLMRVDVEYNKTAMNYAQTICDFNGMTNKEKNVHVCYKLNAENFWKEMHSIIKEASDNSPL